MLAGLPFQSVVAGVVAGFMEGSGIPYPGGPLLTIIGAATPTLPAASLLATIFSAAYVASSVAQYYLGAVMGPFMERLLPQRIQERMAQLLERHGEPAVLWTRPLAVGNYISIPAGMMRMPIGRFLLYTFVGIWPWAFLMTIAGTYLGAYLKPLAPLLEWLPYVGAAVAVLACLIGVHRIRVRVRLVKASDK